jgi:hypothetical protein
VGPQGDHSSGRRLPSTKRQFTGAIFAGAIFAQCAGRANGGDFAATGLRWINRGRRTSA